ncbi:MAG: Glu/Leu/Phe/Val dehydrogenase [Bacteroidetes bacterium]|jgi:leucine dehydrogenase|nr:Glu/Leu/Phe/Val dehydrogenase [Bacteroidota bacterium]
MSTLSATLVETENYVFEKLTQYDYEQLVMVQDKSTGLKGIIAIHNTVLGPGLGGTRMYAYANERDAIVDVLRLSRGMTYKAAVSGLNLGGAKAVLIGDPTKLKSEAYFRKFGRYIENLNGKYITAEDVGTTTKDMEYIAMETENVVGLPESMGGGGDPSPVTAYGVYLGMKASAKVAYGSDSLNGKTVLVEGVGKVGTYLVERLAKEGARILISDVNESALKAVSSKYRAEIVPVDAVFDAPMDIYAPCALGARVNTESIAAMKCQIIAGGANNQLAKEDQDSLLLKEKGILYAPDFLINAGGLINVYTEWNGYNRETAMSTTENIYDSTLRIYEIASSQDSTTLDAAKHLAEKRIADIAKVQSTY